MPLSKHQKELGEIREAIRLAIFSKNFPQLSGYYVGADYPQDNNPDISTFVLYHGTQAGAPITTKITVQTFHPYDN